MPDEIRKVPLVASAPISEFGDFDPKELAAGRPQGLENDGSYVPGFSESRVDWETKVGEYNRGEINRSQIPKLDVNLRWARIQNKAGQPDNTKPFKHARKGYRFVTKEDQGKPWFTELPGGTQWNAAGQLQNGDSALMVASAIDAARNQDTRRKETEARMTGVTNSLTQNLAQVQSYKGADPYVDKTIGPPLGGDS